MKFFLVIGNLLLLSRKIFGYFWRQYQIAKFLKCGKNVWIGNGCVFTYDSISIGDDVYIGNNACFQSTHGKILIGDHVMFGPNVHIHGGNHVINAVGVYMKHVSSKTLGSDGVVKIGNDVWIGAGAMILKGVSIGDGSVIGAGSIITHDVPPYTVIVGSLPRKSWNRFDSTTLAKHRSMIADKQDF